MSPHESDNDERQEAAQSFEESLGQLEEIVHELEEGGLGLGESLARYEEGIAHLRRCYQALREAEQKIELLAGVDEQGNPVTEPFGEAKNGGPAAKRPRQPQGAGRKAASPKTKAPPQAEKPANQGQKSKPPPGKSTPPGEIDAGPSLF